MHIFFFFFENVQTWQQLLSFHRTLRWSSLRVSSAPKEEETVLQVTRLKSESLLVSREEKGRVSHRPEAETVMNWAAV